MFNRVCLATKYNATLFLYLFKLLNLKSTHKSYLKQCVVLIIRIFGKVTYLMLKKKQQIHVVIN